MNPQVPISQTTCFQLLRRAVAFDDIVYINGLPSVGKTTLTKILLSEIGKGYLCAYIDCHYAVNQSKLYLDILSNFDDNYQETDKRGKVKKQRQLISFIEFDKICQENRKLKKKEKLLVVLDNVDQLRNTVLMDSLVALIHMDKTNLILINHETSSNFLNTVKQIPARAKLLDRLNIIEIPPFPEDEARDFITMHEPKRGKDLYEIFVNNTVKLVYPINTKDFVEVKTFCQDNFEKFLQHYDQRVEEYREKYGEDKELPESFTGTALTTFFKSFKKMLKHKDMMSWQNVNLDTQVCYGTSLLIFAAYLAAHTRPSADKINFVKFQKRLGKRKANMRETDTTAREFTLERMIQITKGLGDLTKGVTPDDEEVDPSDYFDVIMRDVDLLENLGIIRQTAGNGLDLHTRFKLRGILPQVFYERIALQLQIPLAQIYGLPFTTETQNSIKQVTK